jgi:hypothetical protein
MRFFNDGRFHFGYCEGVSICGVEDLHQPITVGLRSGRPSKLHTRQMYTEPDFIPLSRGYTITGLARIRNGAPAR